MKLRIAVSLEFDGTFACVEQSFRPSGWSGIVSRAGLLLGAALCKIGIHRMVEVEERSCCWGGVDQCVRCGTEENWSNSYL